MSDRQLQQAALRRHAVPLLGPSPGLPLIKSVANLGRRLEWRKGRSVVDADMPEEQRKSHVYRDFGIFVEWMEKEDGAHYRNQVTLSGPFPHFEAKPNDVQIGDRGGRREVARNLQIDVGNNGKEDYIIEALFDVPEYVTEIPTAIAQDIFGTRADLRPLRAKDWREVIRNGRN